MGSNKCVIKMNLMPCVFLAERAEFELITMILKLVIIRINLHVSFYTQGYLQNYEQAYV